MSVEIFAAPSERSELSSVAGKSEDEYEFAPYLTTNDVRISPGHMIFDNAYDGKHYKQKMIIQNCGDHLALVRLCHPTSSSFQFKAFTEGIYLSPGMRITRTVKYTYNAAVAVHKGFTTIWVNDEQVQYYFIVVLAMAVLSVEPQQLDFGRINAVNHAMTRTFYIQNSGFKGSHFAIDLGRNALEMIVSPMKGMVPARSRVAVTIEVVGTEEGDFVEEFWVKTSPPQRVVVSGSFICPKLLVRKFVNSLDFTLIDFRPTYYGSRSTEPLLIKNFSSSPSMFCVMAEIKGTTMTLEEARKIDDNYRNFIINPIDGRIAALRGAIIQITFSPVHSTKRKERNYAACFLKVVRMDCRDVTSEDKFYGTHLTQIEHSLLGGTLHSFVTPSITDYDTISSLSKDNFSISDNTLTSLMSLIEEEELPPVEDHFSFEHAIGVCLHGEKELAGVILRPTVLILKELTLGKVYQREVLVTNKSTRLPLKVKYQKVISIEMVPPEFELQPGGSTEVLVTIRTLKLTRVEKKVILELFGKDSPDDKKTTYRKVGMISLRVCFETTNVVQRTRSNQCVLCNELPLQLEAEFPYRLSGIELAKKYQNDQIYLSYIRSLQNLPPEENEETKEYDLTQPALLKHGGKCQEIALLKKKQGRYSPYYPLPPMLLYNIKIRPKSLKLRKVAAYTTLSDFFEIENLNIFPIYVFLQASKPYLVFNSYRHVIQSKENKKIYFSFCTSNVGRYYITISILINGSTVYTVTAVAQAVPKTLKVNTTNIEFYESDGNYKFFKVINALNAYTSFDWEVPSANFEIFPQEGGIKAESFIMCMVAYHHDPSEPNTCECVLTSQSGQKRNITVTYKDREASVVFDMYEIDLGLIPLNVSVRKKFTLKNLKNFPISYSVPGGIRIPGITISPHEGILEGLDSQVFTIYILVKAVVSISTNIVFIIQEDEEISIDLKGVVEYPQISLVPHSLYFRKISPYSYDTLAFQISNLCNCDSYISFPLEEFPDFTINENVDDLYSHQETIVLGAKQAKVLFLHFYPQYVSTYVFYLPYTINAILGPAHIKSGQSITSNFFLKEATQTYEKDRDLTVKRIPKGVPVIRINSSAIGKVLEFSSLKINFFYYGDGSSYNVVSTDFEITNISTETVEVCIRTDDLQDPFSLTPKTYDNVETNEVSYKITLEPSSVMVLEAEFFPIELGTYVVRLPIFLKNYYNNRIFNHLTLSGVYQNPTITPMVNRCDFEPVPLRVRNEYHLTLQLKNHFDECELSMESTVQDLMWKIEKVTSKKPETEMGVVLWYDCREVLCLDTEIVFKCSCDSSCVVRVTGVVETCLVTSHAFCQMLRENDVSKFLRKKQEFEYGSMSKTNKILFNDNETCYPLFPKDDDTSWYGVYMRRVQKILENWLFTQIFYKKNYYRIPEGFSDCCKVGESAKKKRFGGYVKPRLTDLPLLELIRNIAGNHITDQLSPSCPQELDDMVWFRYTCNVNSNVLNYLRSFTVYLPQVKSKFLLNYDQYVVYKKIKCPQQRAMPEAIFYRLSKQCWIDLILQIFKTFFLSRTVRPATPPVLSAVESQIRFRQRQSFSLMSRLSEEELEIILDPGICGKHVEEIKDWLKQIYDDQRTALWSPAPGEKDFNSLDLELRDGLILGALTAHYCPYMKNEIKDMYIKPNNPEETFHNICVVVNTWQKLHLSYEFSPLWMEKCTMLEMLLLCSYLHAVLPNFLPREEITIDAPLTQTASRTIDLENLGKDPIRYRMIFIGNENNLFRVVHTAMTVEPKRKKPLKIKYHAKSVKTTIVTLIFSGETPGFKYGRTFVVTLIGQADVSYACMTIALTTDLYRLCDVTIHVESPFRVKADYSVLFGHERTNRQKRNVLYPWEVMSHLKTIKEFVFRHGMWKFDDEGHCTLNQLFCCLQTGPTNVWLCFTNSEVGDWAIRIVKTGKVNPECIEDITAKLPDNYDSLVCRCKKRPSVTNHCPMIIPVKFPMKNNPLWRARKKMILESVNQEELIFWNKRLFTPTGTRILKLILNSETHPLKQPIEDDIKYKVDLDAHSSFVTLKHVVIEDVISEDYFDLPIHPVTDLRKVKQARLRLISADGLETRYYRLNFVHNMETGENSTEKSE